MSTPDALRDVAALLDATAAGLPRVMADLAAYHRPDVWTGGRADRFGRELEDQQQLLRSTADDLHRQAADMRRQAGLHELLLGPTRTP
jgi:hypothetical protein